MATYAQPKTMQMADAAERDGSGGAQSEPAASEDRVRTGLTRAWVSQVRGENSSARLIGLAFHHCHAMVYATAYRITGSQWDAEDITQGVFETLTRKLDDLRDPTRIPGFLKRCAVHASMRNVRRRKWWQGKRNPEVLADPTEDRGLGDAHGSAVVRELLQHLTTEERAAVILKYVDQHSHEEVARLMDTSVSTARRRLDSARKKLEAIASSETELAVLRKLGDGK